MLKPKHEAVMRKAAAVVRARGHEGDARLADSLLGVVASLSQPLPAEQPSNPVALTDSEILLMTCQHTGQRINLRVDECQQHIDFARAIEARIVGQQTKGGGK